jgi:uncharacterized protein YbaR (Trm112 family)
MRRDLLPILACPLCKASLGLTVEAEAGGEVITGVLSCEACNEEYPITDAIPNLLPPDSRE